MTLDTVNQVIHNSILGKGSAMIYFKTTSSAYVCIAERDHQAILEKTYAGTDRTHPGTDPPDGN